MSSLIVVSMWTVLGTHRKGTGATNLCSDQIRYICILGTVILLQRRRHLALQHSIPDSSQVDGIGQRPGLRFLVGRAHAPLAIDIIVKPLRLFCVCPGGRWAREIAVLVVSP